MHAVLPDSRGHPDNPAADARLYEWFRRAGPDRVDSAELAAREARLRGFLAEQAEMDSALRAARRDRPLLAELVVERPTLVAFFPRAELANDSVVLQQRLRLYQEVAESSGWQFEQRYSMRLWILLC